jgi:sugar diacid utilization regulator
MVMTERPAGLGAHPPSGSGRTPMTLDRLRKPAHVGPMRGTGGGGSGGGTNGGVNGGAAAPPNAIAAAAAADAGDLDPTLLADYLEVLGDVAATNRRLTRPELGRFRFQGRRAALDGVPLRALVELYLTAAWRLWRHLPAVREAAKQPDALVLAGEAVLRAVDEAVAAGVEGHQLARRELTRREEAARRELFDDLLSGRSDAIGIASRAADFGLHLAGPHAVAVISAAQPFVDGTPLVTRIETAVLGTKGDANALVASKDGLLVVVFAAPDEAAVEFVTDRLAEQLGTQPSAAATSTTVQLRRPSEVGRWQITLGRARPGAGGVFASYEEALDARELAARLRLEQPVVAAKDLLVYRMLLRDRSAITDLVGSTLKPLTQARGGAAPLLETLAAYYETGGNTTETARRLHLSVRAVTYRLERVTALTGRDPTNPTDRFTLNTAVLGAKLIDWPRRPLEV